MLPTSSVAVAMVGASGFEVSTLMVITAGCAVLLPAASSDVTVN